MRVGAKTLAFTLFFIFLISFVLGFDGTVIECENDRLLDITPFLLNFKPVRYQSLGYPKSFTVNGRLPHACRVLVTLPSLVNGGMRLILLHGAIAPDYEYSVFLRTTTETYLLDTAVPCLSGPCDYFYSSNSTDSIQLIVPEYAGTVFNWAGFLFELQLIENTTTTTNGSYVLAANDIVHVSSQWTTKSEEITEPIFGNSSWTFELAPSVNVKLRTYKWDGCDNDSLWIRFDDEEPIIFPIWRLGRDSNMTEIRNGARSLQVQLMVSVEEKTEDSETSCDDFFRVTTDTDDLKEMIITSGDRLYAGNLDCYWRIFNKAEVSPYHIELRISFQHISLEGYYSVSYQSQFEDTLMFMINNQTEGTEAYFNCSADMVLNSTIYQPFEYMQELRANEDLEEIGLRFRTDAAIALGGFYIRAALVSCQTFEIEVKNDSAITVSNPQWPSYYCDMMPASQTIFFNDYVGCAVTCLYPSGHLAQGDLIRWMGDALDPLSIQSRMGFLDLSALDLADNCRRGALPKLSLYPANPGTTCHAYAGELLPMLTQRRWQLDILHTRLSKVASHSLSISEQRQLYRA